MRICACMDDKIITPMSHDLKTIHRPDIKWRTDVIS